MDKDTLQSLEEEKASVKRKFDKGYARRDKPLVWFINKLLKLCSYRYQVMISQSIAEGILSFAEKSRASGKEETKKDAYIIPAPKGPMATKSKYEG